MILKVCGKFTVVFLMFIVGLVLLSFICRGEICGNAISVVFSEITKTEEANILIEKPQNNESVQSPFILSGTARVFEGTVFYELKDALGELLASGTIRTQGNNAKAYLPFTESITYNGFGAPAGKLILFDISPKDGSKLDEVIVQLALTYKP